MRFKLSEVDKKWTAYALAGAVCVLLFVVLTNLGKIVSFLGAFSTVLIGFAIAYILNPLAKFFEGKVFAFMRHERARWIVSVTVTLVLTFAVISALLAILIPQIVSSVGTLMNNMDFYTERLMSIPEKFDGYMGELVELLMLYFVGDSGIFTTIGAWLVDNMGSIINTTTNLGSKAVNWAIGLIIAIYFLCAKDAIKREFDRLIELILSPSKYIKTKVLLSKFNGIFSRYIVFELVDALIIGVANCLFMLVCGMPGIAIISVVVAVANLAPTFGPIVGGAIGAFLLLLLNPADVIPFIIFTFVIQTIDGYILKPKLFGGALNVPGVIILVAIIVFGRILGVTGVLLSIPIAAILVYIYKEALLPWFELRRDLKKYHKEVDN